MSRTAAWTLRASSLWAVWVWGVLVRNMVVDRTHPVGFRVVHIGLAVVSIAFAGATWAIAGRGRRRANGRGAGPAAAGPFGEPGSELPAPEELGLGR
ncbi:MAG: hypothetical protein ACRDZQ_10455 [Acidimicrobiales bacterium]